MTSTYVDGDIFAADGGALVRFVSGKNDGWEAGAPVDTLLRPGADLLARRRAPAERRTGNVYAFDRPNARIVAFDKVDGAYVAQYRLAGGVTDWTDLRAMYVIPGIEEAPATVVWLSMDGVHQAVLEAVPDVAPAARRRLAASRQPERPARAGAATRSRPRSR